MSYYCDVCDKTITLNYKNKHFSIKYSQKNRVIQTYKKTIENSNMNDINEVFYASIIEHNEKIQ